jgi:hypothetical protein
MELGRQFHLSAVLPTRKQPPRTHWTKNLVGHDTSESRRGMSLSLQGIELVFLCHSVRNFVTIVTALHKDRHRNISHGQALPNSAFVVLQVRAGQRRGWDKVP